MDVKDSIPAQAVISILSFMAFIIPLVGIFWSVKWADKGLHGVMKAIQNGAQQAGNRATNLGKKAAMNSKYGQAAQQFMGQRKSIAQMRGREALRGTLEKNPSLMKIMGGVGGQKYAARFLDAEQRRQHAEDVKNLQEGLTGNVASYGVAERGDIGRAMRDGYWRNANGTRARDVTDSDRAAVRKLQSEGYMDSNYNITKADPRLANAALGSIMEAEIATPENVAQLATYLHGAGEQENALFSKNLQSLAGAHKYKNIQYDDVSDGQIRRYYIKSGGQQVKADGTMETPDEAAARGADKVLDSGLRGVQKDSLDPTMDTSLLDAIQRRVQSLATDEEKKSYIIKIADQTRDTVEKGPILNELASRLGTDSDTLGKIQISLRSGGASPMPPGFPGGTPAPAPAPAPAPVPGPAPTPPAPVPAPTLVVPHTPPPRTTTRPRPGGNFPSNPNP